MCDFTTIYTLSNKQRLQLAKELNIDAVASAVITQLYDDRKVNDKTATDYFKTHYEPLKQAVYEGFGKRPVQIEYNTPNYEFLKQLQTNTAVFATFKSHAAIKDMAALLKDTGGNLRTREDFKTEALKVDANYRSNHLDTEYDTAVRQARMAANWQRYVKNKRLYPNLKYVRSKAAVPDEKHLAYVGIIAPLDSAFWNTNYPPNRWRCQCSAEPTDEAPTDIPDNLPPVPDEFAFNSGKTGQVFNIEKSDYIKSVPPKEQPALIKKAEAHVNKEFAAALAYSTMYKSKGGGVVDVHPLTLKNNDFEIVYKTAVKIANMGHHVQLLPDLQEAELRKELLPLDKIKPGKNPDYFIDQDFVADLKTLHKATPKAVHNAISGCHEQCDNIVLDVTEDNTITVEKLMQYAKGKLSHKEYKSFGNVWINFKGKWIKTTRDDIVKNKSN